MGELLGQLRTLHEMYVDHWGNAMGPLGNTRGPLVDHQGTIGAIGDHWGMIGLIIGDNFMKCRRQEVTYM